MLALVINVSWGIENGRTHNFVLHLLIWLMLRVTIANLKCYRMLLLLNVVKFVPK